MWVTCHQCNGTGLCENNNHENMFHENTYILYNRCLVCWFGDMETYYSGNTSVLRGQLWVEDNYEPITPPTSPRH